MLDLLYFRLCQNHLGSSGGNTEPPYWTSRQVRCWGTGSEKTTCTTGNIENWTLKVFFAQNHEIQYLHFHALCFYFKRFQLIICFTKASDISFLWFPPPPPTTSNLISLKIGKIYPSEHRHFRLTTVVVLMVMRCCDNWLCYTSKNVTSNVKITFLTVDRATLIVASELGRIFSVYRM